MKRAKTDTFIHELPLVVTPEAERTLDARFEGGQSYACS